MDLKIRGKAALVCGAGPVDGSRAEVTEVLDTPAEEAGIKSGDILLQVGKKRISPIPRIRGKPAIRAAAELHQHNHRDRSVRGRKIRNRLRRAIVQHAEIFFL